MFDSIAVDRNTGNLYAVWIDGRFSNFQYNGIALSMSSDGGLTWSPPIPVNKTPNTVPAIDRQAWNPTVAVAADGTVAVSYYDFRNNTPAPGCPTDYWLAYWHPSAKAPATNPANWREVRLTDTSFNLEQAPVPGKNSILGGRFWLGEYEGLAAAGNDFVAVWAMPDGSSTNQGSIFFRRINSGDTAAPSLAVADALSPAAASPSTAALLTVPLVNTDPSVLALAPQAPPVGTTDGSNVPSPATTVPNPSTPPASTPPSSAAAAVPAPSQVRPAHRTNEDSSGTLADPLALPPVVP
jgi:hypothetical protein